MSDKLNTKFGEIGTIRDILMGQQMSEYEDRFTEIKQMLTTLENDLRKVINEQDVKFSQKLDDLTKETNNRFEMLEKLLEKNVTSIQKQMDQNRKTDKHKLGKMFAKIGAQLMDEGKD